MAGNEAVTEVTNQNTKDLIAKASEFPTFTLHQGIVPGIERDFLSIMPSNFVGRGER